VGASNLLRWLGVIAMAAGLCPTGIGGPAMLVRVLIGVTVPDL
jgi:hypothetical protein